MRSTIVSGVVGAIILIGLVWAGSRELSEVRTLHITDVAHALLLGALLGLVTRFSFWNVKPPWLLSIPLRVGLWLLLISLTCLAYGFIVVRDWGSDQFEFLRGRHRVLSGVHRPMEVLGGGHIPASQYRAYSWLEPLDGLLSRADGELAKAGFRRNLVIEDLREYQKGETIVDFMRGRSETHTQVFGTSQRDDGWVTVVVMWPADRTLITFIRTQVEPSW